MNTPLASPERQRRISAIARSIWESEGRPEGQSLRHWLIAEKLVTAQEQAAVDAADRSTEQGHGPE